MGGQWRASQTKGKDITVSGQEYGLLGFTESVMTGDSKTYAALCIAYDLLCGAEASGDELQDGTLRGMREMLSDAMNECRRASEFARRIVSVELSDGQKMTVGRVRYAEE
jgi:hypothetical protein